MKIYLTHYYNPFIWSNTYILSLSFFFIYNWNSHKVCFKKLNTLFFLWKRPIVLVKNKTQPLSIRFQHSFKLKNLRVLSNKGFITKVKSDPLLRGSVFFLKNPLIYRFLLSLNNFYYFQFWLGFYINFKAFNQVVKLSLNPSSPKSFFHLKKNLTFPNTRINL